MSIHKKNIIILSLLDVAYVILSINIVLSYYLGETTSWYAYIPFAIILIIGAVGLLVYRKQTEALLPIAKWQYTLTRVLTLAFLIVYVVQMLLVPNPREYQASLSILIASFLGVISLVSLSLHIYILWRGHKK